MALDAHQPEFRLPIAKVGGAALGAAAVTGAAAAVYSGLTAGTGAAVHALWAAAAVLAATGGTAALTAALGPATALSWAFRSVALSGVRIGASLGLALAIYIPAEPSKLPFWGAFLACSAAALAAETVVVRGFVGRSAARSGADESDQPSTTAELARP